MKGKIMNRVYLPEFVVGRLQNYYLANVASHADVSVSILASFASSGLLYVLFAIEQNFMLLISNYIC